MDVEHMINVVRAEHRFIQDNGLGYDDVFDLLCALKVNNFQAMQCLTTVSLEKTIPIVMHGAGLIYDHYERNGMDLSIASRAERVAIGAWLLHFNNLLEKVTPLLCEGNKAQALGMLNELFIAMLVAGYQFGASMRKGYECAE